MIMKKNSVSRIGERQALLGKDREQTATADCDVCNISTSATEVVSPCYSSVSEGGGDSHHCGLSRHHSFELQKNKITEQDDDEYLSSNHSLLRKSVFSVMVYSVVVLALIIAMYHHHSMDSASHQTILRLSPTVVTNNDDKESENLSFLNGAYSTITNEPLSYKSPAELGIPVYNNRPENSRPGSVFGSVQKGSQIGVPLPTNEWYLNLVVGLDDSSPGPNGQYENYSGEENRVYTIPYIVDTVGSVVGIRLHYPNVLSYGTVVQTVFVPWHGLTLGTADEGFSRRYQIDEETLPSKLGVGIRWDNHQSEGHFIRSSILRGMPYGTMEYANGVTSTPTIASEIVAELPIIDGSMPLECGSLDPFSNRILQNSTSILVKEDVELFFPEADFTWLVFFSRPVRVQCFINKAKVVGTVSLPPGAASINNNNRNAFQLRVEESLLDDSIDRDEEPLIVRVALANNCTRGTNVNFCSQNRARDQSSFMSVLREHSHVYPTSPTVKYAFADPEGALTPDSPDSKSAYLFFDWAAKSFSSKKNVKDRELIMFALPHHIDILRQLDGQSSNEVIDHCAVSLHGIVKLVKGGLWAMEEELGGLPSFLSPRPPNHRAIPALAEALSRDIEYSLPDNYMRGAGDTYFSGKMLAKLGRIIVIAQELRGLAERPDENMPDTSTPDGKELFKIIQECKRVALPTEEDVVRAVDRLKEGVEIWLNGTALTPFTFDSVWGGMVSCGCLFNGFGCDNVYPNCPGYTDPGLNFGNGYYNDHHFHYGYHIYAAAVAAQFDRNWGRVYFEKILLLIRDIANPSLNDKYFPVFRQKDWYLGNSWASGIALFGGRPYLNGRNQESSSEAIAAYEGMAMFGSVMMKSFGNGKSTSQSDNENAYTACQIFNIGRFLATTEIRSADRYWHVYSPKRDSIYPDSYTPAVVSMMWDTMCQFQTWFGSAPYLAYGIQLLPLTPVSERRDTDQWIRQLYPSFVESCDSSDACVNEGWAILLYAVLATLGHTDMAMEKALALSDDIFTSAGGSGHSLSNTLWYIASRPTPVVPYDLDEPSSSIHSKAVPESEMTTPIDCGCPSTCTEEVLEANADGFTCKERIQWLMANKGLNELGSCSLVATIDYQSTCGSCDPELCAGPTNPTEDKSKISSEEEVTLGCPPCNADVCSSDINRCQISTAPYLCYEGAARGGCSAQPWTVDDGGPCSDCCELFKGC